MILPPKTPAAALDLYLAHARIRAEVPMQGCIRLFDLFDNAPGDFITGSMRLASALGDVREVNVARRDVVVRLRDVRRFISASDASVRFVGVPEPLECEFPLVNGSRVSALYEVG